MKVQYLGSEVMFRYNGSMTGKTYMFNKGLNTEVDDLDVPPMVGGNFLIQGKPTPEKAAPEDKAEKPQVTKPRGTKPLVRA